MEGGIPIQIDGELKKTAKIEISPEPMPSAENPAVLLTNGLKGKGDVKNFSCNDDRYIITLNPDGEAVLAMKGSLTFDANDGSDRTQTQDIALGMEQEYQATAFTRSGYSFIGWNTAEDGTGTDYENQGVVNLKESTTLYAQWKKNPSTKYAVTVNEAENGTVTASAKKASAGHSVTLTAKPDEGYVVDTISSKDEKGNEVALTDKGDGTYTFTMPKADVTVTAAFKVDESGGQHRDYDECRKDNNCPIYPFKDSDPKAWYHDGVHWAIDEGVMNGTSQTTFEPNNNTTRAMIVTMLWRMEGEPAAVGDFFTDVDPDSWYGQAVNWAAANEIVKGYNETTFGPKDPITREQLAAILYRYDEMKAGSSKLEADSLAAPQNDSGNSVALNEEDVIPNEAKDFAPDSGMKTLDSQYTDAAQVSEWAKEPMLWAVTKGIITGMTETTLAPQGEATRAQVATMLMRYCEGARN